MSRRVFVALTVSDSRYNGECKDTSGPLLVRRLSDEFPGCRVQYDIVPDEEDKIANALIHYSDEVGADAILTTGGTGLAPRDVTPEATRRVLHRLVDGISTAMCVESLRITPMAMVSRAVSGVRNETLIINLPGSAKAVDECFNVVRKILAHAIDLIKNDAKNVNVTHKKLQGCHGCGREEIKSERPRSSPFPMIEMDEAAKRILDAFKGNLKLDTITVPYIEALGCVAAEDVFASDPFPPFKASIKDGYACLAADGPGERTVRFEASAGDDVHHAPLKTGECATINTGAPIPLGADCVVQIEDTKVVKTDNGKEKIIEILVKPIEGQDIRPIGSDVEQHEMVIRKGTLIGPADIGMLATVGKIEIPIFQTPKIGILSTGNELISPSADRLEYGKIRDSNKATLLSLFRKCGIQVIDLGIVLDDRKTIKEKLNVAFEQVDVLITTGSVSMGEKDYLKSVLVFDFQADILFGRLNMKPGKPTTFATCKHNGIRKFVFALPGNPVSAFVTTQILVLPALRHVCGVTDFTLPKLKVTLTEDVELDPRPQYARAQMCYSANHDYPLATLTGNQISSRLKSASDAQILLELPGSSKNMNTLKKGSTVTAIII